MPKKIELPDGAYIVLGTGDRKWTDRDCVRNVLLTLPSNTVLVHGDAKGLDTILHEEALTIGLGVVPCPAHWRHNEPKCVKRWGMCPIDCIEVIGRPAGVLRNRWMYDTYHPTLVIGFHDDIENSRGTKDMLKIALRGKTDAWLFTSRGEAIHNPNLLPTRVPRKTIPPDLFDWT